MSEFIKTFLEDHTNSHVRASLLGSLAENLMTIGQVSGRFLSCKQCGTSVTTVGAVLTCHGCDATYELKPDSTYRGQNANVQTRLLVRDMARQRLSPINWFVADENWSVADFFFQILRLPAESFLPPFLERLGVHLRHDAKLINVFFWPRLLFGRKTVQPDVLLVYDGEIVMMEFKRPAGASVPAREIAGQIAFGELAASKVGIRWHLLVVPGPRTKSCPSSIDLVQEATQALPAAEANWSFGVELLQRAAAIPPAVLANAIAVAPWEAVLDAADHILSNHHAESWTTRNVQQALRDFHRARANHGYFEEQELYT